MEDGANSRVKLVPRPSMFAVTGAIFAGSVMEFVSSGLAALSVIVWPRGSTADTPLIGT